MSATCQHQRSLLSKQSVHLLALSLSQTILEFTVLEVHQSSLAPNQAYVLNLARAGGARGRGGGGGGARLRHEEVLEVRRSHVPAVTSRPASAARSAARNAGPWAVAAG